MRELECRLISDALVVHDGNVSAAARRLRIGRTTLIRRVRALRLRHLTRRRH